MTESGSDVPTEAAPAEEVASAPTGLAEPTGLAATLVGELAAPAGSTASSSAPPPHGFERYKTGRKVGEGGMGVVCEAEDLQFGRMVAFKRMSAGGDLGRFGVEAVVTANLEHPGIPTVFERGLDDEGRPFYAMRMVRGRTLSQAIREADSLEDKLRLLPAIVDVAQTIAYAHQQGVIHRDIKPDNVVVGAYGDTVVLDWGVAKVRGVRAELSGSGVTGAEGNGATEGSTQHGSVVGTPSYMSPEQAAGRVDEVDERSDVFSLGALLYQVFVGAPPYLGRTSAQRIAAAIQGKPPSLGEAAPKAPAPIRDIVDKAMSRSPSDRFRSAGEFAEALQEAIARGLRKKESAAVRVAVDAAGIVAAIVMFGLLGFFFMEAQVLDLGFALLLILPTFVLGTVLSGVEWWTLGRYKLSPLLLALAAMTLLEGLVFVAFGYADAQAAYPTLLETGATDLQVAEAKMRVAGILVTSFVVPLQFCAAQLAAWAIARRRTLRARA